jgi:hypothetical protein
LDYIVVMHQDFFVFQTKADEISGQTRLAAAENDAEPLQRLQFGSSKTDP